VLRIGGELRIGFLSHDLQIAREMGYLDDMETIFNSKIRKHGIINEIMFPIAPPCALDTMVIVRLNQSAVPYDFALGSTPMTHPFARDIFSQMLRQGNHVQPPNKALYTKNVLIGWARTGHADQYQQLIRYLLLKGPDYDLFPNDIHHWVHPDKKQSLFYLYSFFADTLHFLYNNVDLAKAFSETPVEANLLNKNEWDLQTIKNDPSLTAKLKCYKYILGEEGVHLIGKGEQCFQEFDTGPSYNRAWHDFFLQFLPDAQSNQAMSGHKGRIAHTAAGQLMLSVSSRFDLPEIQPDSIKLLIRSDMDSTVWCPDSVILEQGYYRVNHEVLGSEGCMAFLAPDRKVSQLYYRVFDQSHIQQDTLTVDSTMSFFVPSADMQAVSSRLFFAQYMGKAIGEENYGTRYAYLFHLASDRVCSGTLYFYCPDYVVDQTASLSVFRLQKNGCWQRIPTVFDVSGDYCWADINKGGTYTLFDNSDPVLSVTPHLTTVPASAGSLTLSIDNSNVGVLDWSVSSNASWLTLSGDVSGQDNGSVTAHYGTHTDSTDRYAELNFVSNTASNSPIKVVFKQSRCASGQNQQVSVKVFLEGPFQTDQQEMVSAYGEALSLDSPFIQAPRHVDEVPTGCIDWVKIALYANPTAMPVVQRSCFLHKSGQILDIDNMGLVSQMIEFVGIPDGSYYLQISHRNHLAATSKAMPLQSGIVQEYDFTASGAYFFSNRTARAITSDCWVVRSGDLNQDGQVTTADYVLWYNARLGSSTSAKQLADVNLNRTVDLEDFEMIINNAYAGATTGLSKQE
jgi:hypothetical protein